MSKNRMVTMTFREMVEAQLKDAFGNFKLRAPIHHFAIGCFPKHMTSKMLAVTIEQAVTNGFFAWQDEEKKDCGLDDGCYYIMFIDSGIEDGDEYTQDVMVSVDLATGEINACTP